MSEEYISQGNIGASPGVFLISRNEGADAGKNALHSDGCTVMFFTLEYCCVTFFKFCNIHYHS